jgi:hypothetical protein
MPTGRVPEEMEGLLPSSRLPVAALLPAHCVAEHGSSELGA